LRLPAQGNRGGARVRALVDGLGALEGIATTMLGLVLIQKLFEF